MSVPDSFETANGAIRVGARVHIIGGGDEGATGTVVRLYFPPDQRRGMADVRLMAPAFGTVCVRGVYLRPV
jgi:ribosomal protein L24